MVTEKRKKKSRAKPSLRFIVDDAGRPTEVVLPIEEYRRLIEDMEDLGVIIARRDEPGSSLEEVEKRLRKSGVLPS